MSRGTLTPRGTVTPRVSRAGGGVSALNTRRNTAEDIAIAAGLDPNSPAAQVGRRGRRVDRLMLGALDAYFPCALLSCMPVARPPSFHALSPRADSWRNSPPLPF
jgi:hypothetical protein